MVAYRASSGCLFIIGANLLNLTPGQDAVLHRRQERIARPTRWPAPVLGIVSGSVIHTFAAAFGLSTILATSAQGFVVMKLAGAVYLAYLGVRRFLERPTSVGTAAGGTRERDWAV